MLKVLFAMMMACLSIEDSQAATFVVADNKYANAKQFLENYAKLHDFTLPNGVRERLKLENTIQSLDSILVSDLPYDEFKGCEQIGYAFTTQHMIELKGEIEKNDDFEFKKAFSAAGSTESGCGVTLVVDSSGGDLDATLKIAEIISKNRGAVVVAEGGKCLSACVFLLLAARYEDEDKSISKAFAFSDSIIAVHWPILPEEAQHALNLVGNAERALNQNGSLDSGLLFNSVGRFWSRINSRAINSTRSSWLAIALLNSFDRVPPGHQYVVNSALERRLAGINSIILPSGNDALDTSKAGLRNLCLADMVEPGSRRISDSLAHEARIRDIYVLYYPSLDKVCVAKVTSGEIQNFVSAYDSAGNLEVNSNSKFSRADMTRAKKYVAKQLLNLGMGPKSSVAEFGKKISNISTNDMVSGWRFFSILNERYACVLCGNYRGNVVFNFDADKCAVTNNETNLTYLNSLKAFGFKCDTELNILIFAKLLFFLSQKKDADGNWPWSYEFDIKHHTTTPPFLRSGTSIISEECGTESEVCSNEIGSEVNGEFKVDTIAKGN